MNTLEHMLFIICQRFRDAGLEGELIADLGVCLNMAHWYNPEYDPENPMCEKVHADHEKINRRWAKQYLK
jgi:hypothetical protein